MSFALKAALEAVKFQIEPVLFEGITRQVTKIRKEKDYTTTAPAVMELISLIQRITDLSVTVVFEDTTGVNAGVFLPDLDRNHPLVLGFRRQYAGSTDALAIFKTKGVSEVVGGVDLRTGRVSGLYKEIDCKVVLTTGLMNNSSLTHEEVAAVILHELGHIFTYFEYITRAVTTNYALLAVAEEVVNAPTDKRITLIDATSKHFNYSPDSLEGLKTATSKEVVYSTLITQHIRQTRSELGANLYDKRGCEHLADQYAARMGASTALVTALAKMNRHNPSRYSSAGFVVFEGFKLMLVALSLVSLGPVVLVMLMISYDPTDKIYDDPEARMRRIRNELIGGMKDKTLSRARQAQMKKDLEIIDQAMSSYDDRRTFYEYLYTTFLPGVRKQNKHIAHQQELEALANNELFAKSMNFKLI